jgi:CRISPR-associated protein Csb2
MKRVRPVYIEAGSVSFLWDLHGDEAVEQATVVASTALRINALGWGIDLVVADGRVVGDKEAAAVPGIRWTPQPRSISSGLRVPVPGTLDDILARHRRFLGRLQSGTLDPAPLLAAYATVAYEAGVAQVAPPTAVFSLLNPNGNGFCAFDLASTGLSVAGMTRHATRTAATRSGWREDRINQVVLGHGERKGASHLPVGGQRLAYVPLPSIEPRGHGEVVGWVRRVMVSGCGDATAEIAWARRVLPGEPLVWEHGAQAALLGIVKGDAVTARYLGPSSRWTTVTPVVLPGYDDPAHYRRRLALGVGAAAQKDLLRKLDIRTDGLVRKAIVQAGLPHELAKHAHFECRRSGFLAGTDLADRYGVPNHLKRFTRLHVRIEWRDASGHPVDVAGPVIIGGGRFYGLGLMTATT